TRTRAGVPSPSGTEGEPRATPPTAGSATGLASTASQSPRSARWSWRSKASHCARWTGRTLSRTVPRSSTRYTAVRLVSNALLKAGSEAGTTGSPCCCDHASMASRAVRFSTTTICRFGYSRVQRETMCPTASHRLQSFTCANTTTVGTPERVGSPPVLSTSGTSTTAPGPRAAPSLTSWAPAAPSARSAKSPTSKYEPRAKIGMVHPPGSASWFVTRCSARTAGMSSTNTLPRGSRPSPRPRGSGRAQHPRSAEQLVDPGRYRHGRRTLADLVEGRGHRARAEVHLDGPGAGSRCRPDEAGGGVDQAGRPDGREHVGLPERVLDLVQVVRDLAEPHHVGPQRGPTAARAGRPVHEVVVPRHALAAAEAASLQQLAVHVQH